ncbi:DUF805 domain-containing protein [Vibrio sp. dsl-7]|uniref:DUF805 domain-containing protein n=1 Tax=Vibrio chanodichtyis TaxID=3027932 RepID=A0ABT5V0W5_9VIBR|nr:DUF805 domain-containing protein [Vibrio chanodichtyis]MDE1514966.1 DUF805 domain-containing protein [Vibrio chanodichtyis]
MSLQTLLLSFQGRVGRRTYWLWNVCYYAMIALFAVLANQWLPNIAHLILPVFLLLVLVPDLAITAKRWHDRDKSSWWLLLNLPLVIGRMTIPTGELAINAEPGMPGTLISLAALLCGAWILVECGFLAGSEHENRFGSVAS